MSEPTAPEAPNGDRWDFRIQGDTLGTLTLNGQTLTIRPNSEAEVDRLKNRIESLEKKLAAQDATIQQLTAELERVTQLLVVDKIVNDRDCSDAVLRAAYFLAREKLRQCLTEILKPYVSREMYGKVAEFTPETIAAEVEQQVEHRMYIVDAHTDPIAAMEDGARLRITITELPDYIQPPEESNA